MNKKKIAVFTGNRAEYGLLHPVIRELSIEPSIDSFLIVSGSHLSDDFGNTISEIDTSNVHKVRIIQTDPTSNDKSGIVLSFARIMNRGVEVLVELQPDIIILAGDRYETFAMAITTFYMNIVIAHIFGGDLSQGGHLDDSVRHSITKLAHLHFTTNEESSRRVLELGEEKWRVFNVGSTVADNINSDEYSKPEEISKEFNIDLGDPIILFTQHPVTTESELAYSQVKESLEALKELDLQTIITYPCNDSGSELIINAIKEYADNPSFRITKSLGWKKYLGILKIASVVAGNSSSGLMETPIFKVPCVNIGSRQDGRLRAENVIDVPYDKEAIKQAISKAITDLIFLEQVKECSNPYGTGGAAKEIVRELRDLCLNKSLLQKKMTF